MRKHRYWKAAGALAALCVAVNVVFASSALSSAYTLHVYHPVSDAVARLTSSLPFALGEAAMYLALLAVLAWLVILILLPFLRKRKTYASFAKRYSKAALMVLLVGAFAYTMAWTIPLRNTPLLNEDSDRTYTVQELGTLRAALVVTLNDAAEQVERDGDGHLVAPEDASQQVAEAMEALGEEYPLLAGPYPRAKAAWCSPVLRWMGIGGYTYPFSSEVTLSRYVTNLYRPFLTGHEMSHHKGYYRESEANFIAFLALVRSDDPLLRYSACEGVLAYVDRAYLYSLLNVMGPDEAMAVYRAQPQVSQRYIMDRAAEDAAVEDLYNAEVGEAPQQLEDAAGSVADAGWSAQADMLQEANYSGVVALLLQYYEGRLF